MLYSDNVACLCSYTVSDPASLRYVVQLWGWTHLNRGFTHFSLTTIIVLKNDILVRFYMIFKVWKSLEQLDHFQPWCLDDDCGTNKIAAKYRVSQKTGPTLFFSISQLLQHLGIKWSALGKNWVLAHLENVQKLTDWLKDAWDIQQGSIRVSFKSENIVLNNV